jgi:hypothetical protein
VSTQSRSGDAAVSDEQLVQLLDGQLSVDDAGALRGRIAADPASAGRLDELRRRGETLSDLLTSVALTDAELTAAAAAISDGLRAARSRRRRARVALLRSAAAIAAIAALATVVPQARAWIADSLLSVVQTLRPTATPSTAAAGHDTDGADMRVTFTAAEGTFRLVIGDPAGTLILRAADAATGSAELTDARGAHLVITTAGVRVDGPLSAGAVIVLTLPASVRDVVVSDGARSVLVPAPGVGEDTTLELLLLLR